MKWLIGIIVVVMVLAGIGYVGLKQLDKDRQPLSVTPTTIPQPDASGSPSITDSLSPSEAETGTISGGLCYPSEVVPPGVIEAKRVTDNVVFTEEYAGSQQQGNNLYVIALEPGTYILRYGADAGGTGDYMYGYHTKNCGTGTETTCGQEEGMENVEVEVETNISYEDFSLCNFYYTESNEPVF
ncbi:MAG: hypothetical protein UU81_C0003G0013 [Microgenomates group bacterium GW2011_GWC1_41_8]|uniref:Uncharacterized protein n=3 Tax=Candidatus Roizmaniibacteriota TaxID=1752723 RepID=A0A0G0ZDV3_9BACT|nr:MAG: hypothetical protein UU14_C0015G0010 [Candidatus Roizmanbacteria bacterium GW2011_GWB1_40_7]KKR94714.1 MAG: hypothetical protein UU41_C0004G0014 [Candidatus Roizmanbacteria bacterium GW2011_GWA1_41_13]KKS20221.1 MAG: hypothetical protein UU78_C0066G0009 [Candidatus Roizmanbacteria bacterium GW2011_GWC2_41_7]KKS24697.1 MAG: hypothetical protein UU81_C0003G0013 [Microgenomates group bacterium GW2011_GWC1_41_8]OGK50027.1 MAG: hypothetical protein A3A55_03640 [Candidatus Roizmanbacteria bac